MGTDKVADRTDGAKKSMLPVQLKGEILDIVLKNKARQKELQEEAKKLHEDTWDELRAEYPELRNNHIQHELNTEHAGIGVVILREEQKDALSGLLSKFAEGMQLGKH